MCKQVANYALEVRSDEDSTEKSIKLVVEGAVNGARQEILVSGAERQDREVWEGMLESINDSIRDFVFGMMKRSFRGEPAVTMNYENDQAMGEKLQIVFSSSTEIRS